MIDVAELVRAFRGSISVALAALGEKNCELLLSSFDAAPTSVADVSEQETARP